MKTAACYVVHYGAEWLRWSMKSISKLVDDIHIFYTDKPSFGYDTDLVCPESKEDILRQAIQSEVKFSWVTCPEFPNEGAHRDFAINALADDFDTILVVDSDEIWPYDDLYKALFVAEKYHVVNRFHVGMRHFWRSVRWVCDDPAMPIRIIHPNVKNDSFAYLDVHAYHMGYAQSPAIIRYKESIHGHKGEWRERWFEDKFMAWKPGYGDVHPTNVNFWNPARFDSNADEGRLYNIISDHPYINLEIIE